VVGKHKEGVGKKKASREDQSKERNGREQFSHG
jgi:hypothetical protein